MTSTTGGSNVMLRSITHGSHRSSTTPLIGIVGGNPVSVEGVRYALARIGTVHLATPDRLLTDGPPGLSGVVLFADLAEQLAAIRSLRRCRCDLPVVALISPPVTCRDALSAGATAVARYESPVEEIVLVVESCLVGRPMVPADLALELMAPDGTPEPTPEESKLLCLLADGLSMRTVAERLGYSERHLYRVLKRLYDSLGVPTKEAAVELAQQRGWLAA